MTYWNLEAWQGARVLTKEVYEVTRGFPREEIYGLAAQMRRASISVASNIAEGEARWSFREQRNFYYVARGSLMELETQLVLSMDLQYIDPPTHARIMKRSSEVGRKLNGLIRSARNRKSEIRDPRSVIRDP